MGLRCANLQDTTKFYAKRFGINLRLMLGVARRIGA
jgi:hypothetical protein